MTDEQITALAASELIAVLGTEATIRVLYADVVDARTQNDALVAENARLRAGIAEVKARGIAMQNEANFDREKYDTGLGWECAGEWLEEFAQETQP